MRTFDHEELSQMGEDWRRNDSLEPVARMKRVAELHGCSPEEAAAALGMATPKKKRPKSYDQHVKDDALKAVLLDGEERKSVAERLGVPEGTLNRWVNEAKRTQQEFLDYPEKVKTQPEEVKTEPEEVKTQPEEVKTKPKKKLSSYDKAVHDDAIKAVLLDGESTRTVAERFGVPLSKVATWVSKAKRTQQEFLDYPDPKFLDDLEPEPEQLPVEKPAPEPAATEEPGPCQESFRTALVDLKALAKAMEGLLDFADLYEEVGFLNAEQARKLCELADQAGCYARGIRWATERSKR